MQEGRRSDDGKVVRLRSGDTQVKVKSQKFTELDIGGLKTCFVIFRDPSCQKCV